MRVAAALLFATLAAVPGAAHAEYADLELVLAVDVSSSVNGDEFVLQMDGLTRAFRNPLLMRALEAAGGGGIAVSLVQWAGPQSQAVAFDFQRVDSPASAEAVAALIEQTPRLFDSGGTSISGAIDFAVLLFASNGFEGKRQTIDISGDGRNNHGRQVTAARDEALARGITINGLAILNEEPNLDLHYSRSVIGGPDSFVMTADDYTDFQDAILIKLVREIGGSIVSRLP